MSSPVSGSGSPYSDRRIEELIARALQAADVAEEDDSVNPDDYSSAIFDPNEETPITTSPESLDQILHGEGKFGELLSPSFPPTYMRDEECTPVSKRLQPTDLTFSNELQKVFCELSKRMALQDIELLSYEPPDRKTLMNLIELFRANMTGIDSYEEFFQTIQTRFEQPIFKDYFPVD
jgi:hypothetical protein